MIIIYNYIDATDYVNDKFKAIQEVNSSFSLRALAMHLGMKSHGPLHAILKKQRNIPKKLVPNLIKSLKITKKEAKYFEALVDFQRAKSPEEMEFYKNRLSELSPTPIREIDDVEAYKYASDHMHLTIAEMSQLKDFQDSAIWIKQHSRIKQNMRDIEIRLERLKKLKILIPRNGKLVKPAEHLYTKYEEEKDTIKNYHKFFSQLAIEQISQQSIHEREYNAVAFNIKKADLPKMKEEIRDFINKVLQDYESEPHEGEETYQLNIQLFSLSK